MPQRDCRASGIDGRLSLAPGLTDLYGNASRIQRDFPQEPSRDQVESAKVQARCRCNRPMRAPIPRGVQQRQIVRQERLQSRAETLLPESRRRTIRDGHRQSRPPHDRST